MLREATRGAWPHGLVGHDVDSRRCVAEVRSEKGLLAVVLDAGPVPAVLWGKQRPPLRCPAPHMASTDGRGRGDRDELRQRGRWPKGRSLVWSRRA